MSATATPDQKPKPARPPRGWRLTLLLGIALLATGCAKVIIQPTPVRVGNAPLREIGGITACGDPTSSELALVAKRPLVVLVHGYGSERDFRNLAAIFALHDQQTVCFRYDHRARVRRSAEGLRGAITQLVRQLDPPDVLVLGHSQGGLVARTALTAHAETPLPSTHYRLVTVASPFGGIRAARDCGSVPLHLGSLGMTMAVCRAVSGAKWNEIHARSSLVRKPAPLAPAVREHFTIVTDERDACRTYTLDGRSCLKDDYVFSVAEQRNAQIERDERVVQSAIIAGHSEIVGAGGDAPRKLLQALQRRGILRDTRPQDVPAVERLTAHVGW